ncbi:MAG: hypothetical protein ABIH41_01075 [Nanoarchaeota archaeon]
MATSSTCGDVYVDCVRLYADAGVRSGPGRLTLDEIAFSEHVHSLVREWRHRKVYVVENEGTREGLFKDVGLRELVAHSSEMGYVLVLPRHQYLRAQRLFHGLLEGDEYSGVQLRAGMVACRTLDPSWV